MEDAPFRCAAGTTVQIRSDGLCDVTGARGSLRLGPHVLPILSVLAVPRPLQEAVGILSAELAGRRDAIGLLATLSELRRVGAITSDDESAGFETDAEQEGFGAVPIHVAMLGDSVRTAQWVRAVKELVRPGDVVVDIGTGTGILAVAAVQAGARHVYALEASSSLMAAQRVIHANGASDHVTLIRGWSTAIELPERADVLVSEILDDDPFGEGVLEATADAWRRHLKPEATALPRQLTLHGTLVEIDNETLRSHTWTAACLEQWSVRYGIDLTTLATSAPGGFVAGVRRGRAAGFRSLSESELLVRLELDRDVSEALDEVCTLSIQERGRCHGLVTHFDAELLPGVVVTTDPLAPEGASHWLNPTLFLPAARDVSPGQTVAVRYQYPRVPSVQVSF